METAVQIVMAAHPVLIAAQDTYRVAGRSHDWDAYVRIGYAAKTTQTDAAGANASLQIKIPLFSDRHRLTVRKARTAYMKTQDAVLSKLYADIERLCTQAATVHHLDDMRQFYRDRLKYRQHRVKEGVEDPSALWAEAEAVQDADAKAAEADAKLSAMRQTVARQYAGEAWARLIQHLPR